MIAILDYGIGNLRSAEKALQHVGADARLVSRPALGRQAQGVVLPGVGAFGACAKALSASGLDAVALQAHESGKPMLAICVGMQLLFEESEESPGAKGLALLPGVVRRLGAGVRRPQMQWNLVRPRGGDVAGLLGTEEQWYYFVHGYAASPAREGDVAGTCEYGTTVVAAVERGNLFGTQFHPEKSGPAGLALLSRFARACGEKQ